MRHQRYLALAGLAAGMALAARHAQANLLSDSDFSSYTSVAGASGSALASNDWPTPDWTVSGGSSGNGNQWFWGLDFDDGDPNDPTGNAMEAFKTTTVGELSQDFSTTANDYYKLSFDYNSGDQATTVFDVSISNADDFTPPLPSGSAPLSEWETMSFDFQATSTSSDLAFEMYNDNSNTEITDVSVSQITMIPEPVLTLPLVFGALLCRRRRRATA